MAVSEQALVTGEQLDTLSINTIRTLAIDAVQQANSGHPGAPMGLAPVGYKLWQDYLRYDPEDPLWPNRDRFVLSAGHASMLLYAILHLTGVRAADGRARFRKSLRSRWKRSSASASSTAARRGIRNRTSPPAWKRPRARSARARATASAWRWPANGWRACYNKPGFDLFDFNVYAHVRRRRLHGRRRQRSGVVGGTSASFRICAGSTTTTASRSTAPRTGHSAKTWRRASSATAGTLLHVADANDLDTLAKAYGTFLNTKDPAHADHRRQPHRVRLSA